MDQNNAIISYLQANNILAIKLDRAVSAVGKEADDDVATSDPQRSEQHAP
ncbi:hypothetical protein [Scandinavium sp.]|nr:hypothetical protein [Scandinavium sp.]